MDKVRLLSLDNLYEYYEQQGKTVHFSASDDNANIIVQVPGKMQFQKSDKDTEGLRPVTLQACHTGENKNKSSISEKAMRAALPSFSNRPILAYVIEVDGQPEFNTHAYHLDDEDNMVYDEIPIGIIPESCEAKLEYDEEKEKTYCVVNGYIYEEYAPVAIEILEREGECAVSVELAVRELSYDSKEKVLNIDDYFYSGVTILGKTEDGEEVKPGMVGSNIKLSDFSAENNSFIFNRDDLVNDITAAVIERLSDKADDSALYSEEGGKEKVKFNELLEKYGKTVEDINFEYEGLSDDELEEAFKKAFEEDSTEETPSEDDSSTEEDPETTEEFNDEPEDNSEEDTSDEEDKCDNFSIKYSVTCGEITKDFSVSLQDKIYALNTLVNDTYGDTDGTWYDVTVYDDEKYVVMKDWWNDKAFKQSYKVKKDVYSLVGDRVEVYAQYLTADEINKLDEMRANYAEISEKLNKYEAEPQKMEILNSDDYANIADTAEFAELKKEENHFDMTVEEVKAEADKQLLEYAKGNKIQFEASNDKKTVGMKLFGKKNTGKTGRYGSLFKK